MLNKDEESEILPFENETNTVPNDASFIVKASMFEDITESKRIPRISNVSDINPHKNVNKPSKPDKSAFEYCIEEDQLSYRSSLHSHYQE